MSDDLDEISQYVVEHTDENAVKSKAIVKHQMVKSMANFARLQCNTDLNIPPTNWLNSNINSYGLQQALSQSTGFSSFRMAHLFPDCVGEVDVVSNAENIKRLLKLPYSPNSTISMMVHRIENTLLIDEFDIHKYLLRQTDDNWSWLRSFIYENILSSLSELDRNVLIQNSSLEATQQRSLLSKFLYHSISGTDDSGTSTASPSTSREPLEVNLLRPPFQITGPLLPEPNMEENVPDPEHTKHTYNRNVVWTFEDIRMLIGTDMAIFGGKSRPCISLRLRDMNQPINVLTGIDYWLDNLMCNVPEVVMCYHLDGLVQKYEIIKTEDLPHMENSEFSPKVIRNVAQNILSFLKQNATKSGHTYWLFKGRNDDVVKLYDLTSLSGGAEAGCPASMSSDSTAANENDGKNPFTVPVAMLLYKVARNMKNSAEHISPKQAGSIKALLDNCIKLLPKEKYPQIVTSSYYLLSDLYVPTGIDPVAPGFGDDTESDTYSVYDDERYNSDNEGTACGSSTNGDDSTIDQMTDNVAVKNLYELNLEKNWKHNSSPPPMNGNVDERCTAALEHIINGLNCLQYFSSEEEKLTKEREEIAKQEERIRIIHEELNPNMARPYQAIPLPYEHLEKKAEEKLPEAELERSSEETAVHKSKKSKRYRKKSSSMHRESVEAANREPKEQSLLPKQPIGIIQSWNVHLKLLMLEKTCLIYAILTEQALQNEQYGLSLKYISLAIKCQQVVTKHLASTSSRKICLWGRAGDCLFQCSQNFHNIQVYIDEFSAERDIDQAIVHELQKDFEGIGDETQVPLPTANVEMLNLTSIMCYETALQYATKKDAKHELVGRMGAVRNELGVKYMMWSQAEYEKWVSQEGKEAGGKKHEDCRKAYEQQEQDDSELKLGEELSEEQHAKAEGATNDGLYLTLARKSFDCLVRGIAVFEEINDDANLAILLCNMGRFMRFRAHLDEKKATFNFKKKCYESAFTHYQRALAILVSRKRNLHLWDLVTWELSTGKYTFGQHMYDYFQNKLTEEVLQEVIELLLSSLKLSDTETESARQILYIMRSGMIYQSLGGIYFHSYKSEADSEVRRKKLLQLCRLYYEKSAKIFETIEAPTEFLHVQIDRINLNDFLFEGTQNASQKWRHLQSSLSILHSSANEFDKFDEPLLEDVGSQLKQFEVKLQLVLKKSIKFCLSKPSDLSFLTKLKEIYALTLRSPKESNATELSQYLKTVLGNLKNVIVE